MWLGSIRPRSQCVGGMLPVQWCYKHVLELPRNCTATFLSAEKKILKLGDYSPSLISFVFVILC